MDERRHTRNHELPTTARTVDGELAVRGSLPIGGMLVTGANERPPPDDPGGERHEFAVLYALLGDPARSKRAFDILGIALVGYGTPILHSWIAGGEIFQRCARIGRPLRPTSAERRVLARDPDAVTELAAESLARGFFYLRDNASAGTRRWDADREASLRTYFVGGCVLQFPAVFRRWQSARRNAPLVESYHDESRGLHDIASTEDPADHAVSALFTREVIAAMPPAIREIVQRRVDGDTFAEIARVLGSTAGALEQQWRRYRERNHEALMALFTPDAEDAPIR